MIELRQCERLSAMISEQTCKSNRRRGVFACSGCPGLGGGSVVVDEFTCPSCSCVLSTGEAQGERCPVCRNPLHAAPPTHPPSVPVENHPIITLMFIDPYDRRMYDILARLA